jgi:hypothetical protein
MITLNSDRLQFLFPEIAVELRQLAARKVDSVLARFLAENRAAAFHTLLNNQLRRFTITDDYRQRASEKLLALTPETIRRAIQHFVGRPDLFADTEPAPTSVATVSFQRTLRIPDDGKPYPLPPGLGRFPLCHVDDHADRVPAAWNKRGGIMMPMYQAEALWLQFSATYPCALKVATGKINAVTGASWEPGLRQKPQDYLTLPDQPWLDGYCVKKGFIRQFVAMPLGDGFTAEEQITGEARHGGLQLQVYPIKPSVHFAETLESRFPRRLADILEGLLPVPDLAFLKEEPVERMPASSHAFAACAMAPDEMGLGAGGMMRQEIYEDKRPLKDYDLTVTSRCFVHLCDSISWRAVTGSPSPSKPITAQDYARYHLPWFDIYREDLEAVPGSKVLDNLRTVVGLFQGKTRRPLPGNESVAVTTTIQYGRERRPDEVREWRD